MKEIVLSIRIRKSRWYLVYFNFIYGTLSTAFFYLPIDTFQLLVLLFLLIISWYYSLRIDSERRRVNRVRFYGSHWFLNEANVEEAVVVVLESATVWRWLVLMNFRDEYSNRKFTTVIFPDSTDPDSFRQLRVLLRHMPVWH